MTQNIRNFTSQRRIVINTCYTRVCFGCVDILGEILRRDPSFAQGAAKCKPILATPLGIRTGLE